MRSLPPIIGLAFDGFDNGANRLMLLSANWLKSLLRYIQYISYTLTPHPDRSGIAAASFARDSFSTRRILVTVWAFALYKMTFTFILGRARDTSLPYLGTIAINVQGCWTKFLCSLDFARSAWMIFRTPGWLCISTISLRIYPQ